MHQQPHVWHVLLGRKLRRLSIYPDHHQVVPVYSYHYHNSPTYSPLYHELQIKSLNPATPFHISLKMLQMLQGYYCLQLLGILSCLCHPGTKGFGARDLGFKVVGLGCMVVSQNDGQLGKVWVFCESSRTYNIRFMSRVVTRVTIFSRDVEEPYS